MSHSQIPRQAGDLRHAWLNQVGGQAVLGRQSLVSTPWLTERHGYDPTCLDACISSRITTVIQVVSDHQINYNCFNEPFAVSPYKSLYLDMHGLIKSEAKRS